MPADDRQFQQRTNVIGASEVATILGLSKWKSPLALAIEKRGIQSESQQGSHKYRERRERRMRQGNFMEAFILDEYQRRHENVVVTGALDEDQSKFIIHDDNGDVLLEAHPDGGLHNVRPRGVRGNIASPQRKLVECKLTSTFARPTLAKEVPDDFWVQVQLQMHAAQQNGRPINQVDLLVLNERGELLEDTIDYDPKFGEQAVEEIMAFRNQYLNCDDQTFIDRATALRMPEENLIEMLGIEAEEGSTLVLSSTDKDPDKQALALEYAKLVHDIADAESVEKEASLTTDNLKNTLRELIADAEGVTLDGKPGHTMKRPAPRRTGKTQISDFHNRLRDVGFLRGLSEEMHEQMEQRGLLSDKSKISLIGNTLQETLVPRIETIAEELIEFNTTESSRRLAISPKSKEALSEYLENHLSTDLVTKRLERLANTQNAEEL